MRHLSRILFAAAVTIATFSTVTYVACKKDKCKDLTCENGGVCSNGVCNCPANYSGTRCEVAGPCANIACQNGGSCNNGACYCPTGYEGNYCESEVRTKFKKTWNASDSNSFNNFAVALYHPIIANGPSIAQVAITLLCDGAFSHDVIGTVSGDSIIIALQTPDSTVNNHTISGNAVLINDTLYWHYTIVNTAPVNYKGTWR